MYPRNAASPPRIAIGAVVQISDGAVQTTGCTVRVIEQGGAEGDGAGTTAYSTDGIVLYTPTQAETDQIAFILIAKKTGCIPVSQTIITSASDVTGYAGLDWSKITAPTTSQNLSGTTIKTATDVETDTVDIQSRLPAVLTAGGDIKADVLAINGVATTAVTTVKAVQGLAVDGQITTVTGNVNGNVAGTVAGVTPSTAAQVAAILTTQITESYRANAAAPTLAQFMCEVLAHLGEAAISGTTKTLLKLDHVTTAETFTLDSATDPATITRAT